MQVEKSPVSPQASAGQGGKRKYGQENALTKRARDAAAAEAEVEASMKVVEVEETDTKENFNPQLLKFYYAHLFPFDEMYKWMCYGHDSKRKEPWIDPTFFMKREHSFTLEGDIYMRFLTFTDAADWKKNIVAKQPIKIDLGAYYNVPAKDKATVRNFTPESRELVFDIDLTDYDPVRTSASGAKITRRCWKLMTAAVKVIDLALREDFGFKCISWIYSGRRGIHCWVCDKKARLLTDQQRSGVAEYLGVVSGSEKTGKAVNYLTQPLHPSLDRAYEILEEIFVDDIIQDHGQQLLSNEAYWDKIIGMLPDIEDLREVMREKWEGLSSATERWELVKTVTSRMMRNKQFSPQQKRDLATCCCEIVFTCTYPRLDVAVSTHRNHLLKSPFCVHPKTGRVCVPFDPKLADEFDPFEVPTLGSLVKQVDDFDERYPEKKKTVSVTDKTAMRGYLDLWDRVFLKPLYSEIRQEFRLLNEEHALESGDYM